MKKRPDPSSDKVATAICPGCQQPFTFYKCSPVTYCSKACRTAHHKATYICPECGKTFEYFKNHSLPRKYCSKECAGKNIITNIKHYAPTRYTAICKVCGTSFETTAKRSKGLLCSRACHHVWLTRLRGPEHFNYKSVERPCVHCGRAVKATPSQKRYGTGRFCGRSCFFAWRNEQGILKGSNNWHWRGGRNPIERTCVQCGKRFFTRRTQSGAKFCTRQCYFDWRGEHIDQRGANNHAYLGGRVGYRGPNWKRQRAAARERDNYTCQRCGITEAELEKKQLNVHHIVRFRKFGLARYKEANHLDNLTCLCDPCHTIVEWEGRNPEEGISEYREEVRMKRGTPEYRAHQSAATKAAYARRKAMEQPDQPSLFDLDE